MTDPYERTKVPTSPTQPWQVRRKWLLVIARFAKVILFPLYLLLYFPVVYPFMILIGYLFWGDKTFFFTKIRTWSNFSVDYVDKIQPDWSWWEWGELEKDD